MSIDLNLENYSYEDLLNLFKINQLTSENLKKAKKIVLKTHPDKCKLDKKVFLFFTSALKKLVCVYEFVENYKSKLDIEKYEYDYEAHTEDEEGLHEILRNDKNFLKNFNELFESTYIKNNDGYSSWLKSDEDVYSTKISKDEMENIRKEVRNSIVVKQDINGIGSSQHYSFDEQTTYGSDVFSKFQYEDLKKAHHETLIPVTDEDYNNIKKYNNVNQLESIRAKEITKPPSLEQSKEYLNKLNQQQEESSINTAFKLIDRDEQIKKRENAWWKKYKQLKNL
jgi:hypothetical protein